jgi:hypothetical protein
VAPRAVSHLIIQRGPSTLLTGIAKPAAEQELALSVDLTHSSLQSSLPVLRLGHPSSADPSAVSKRELTLTPGMSSLWIGTVCHQSAPEELDLLILCKSTDEVGYGGSEEGSTSVVPRGSLGRR